MTIFTVICLFIASVATICFLMSRLWLNAASMSLWLTFTVFEKVFTNVLPQFLTVSIGLIFLLLSFYLWRRSRQ
ncbi:hypothetical protein GTP56_17295 [Duganella sp. FT134W]|uniref:Uncharacterized protein n=1 Tax=Duganella margarita TaxID=2692170 RepID=A0A7X4KI64_9BURK|nr:hypothetical protein [Duganella margarita]MYM73942.1 hypothetical protein [Duganella margarita]